MKDGEKIKLYFKNGAETEFVADNSYGNESKLIFQANSKDVAVVNEEEIIAIIKAEQIELRPMAKWELMAIDRYKCSHCGYYGYDKYNFCPRCGSDMY